MDARFAFSAQFWGDGAVVCRAIEDRPGPIVEQQFGEFPTWTQAHAFATKLNEGLDLDALTVRQIVTSSLLATACVIQEALSSTRSRNATAVEDAARAAQLRFLLAELALAITFCRTASLLPGASILGVLSRARATLHHSAHFLRFFDGDYAELKAIVTRTEELNSVFQRVVSSLNDAGETVQQLG
jgi:hypothetical protein